MIWSPDRLDLCTFRDQRCPKFGIAYTDELMHDEDWTQRLVAGRENELDNLAQPIVDERGSSDTQEVN